MILTCFATKVTKLTRYRVALFPLYFIFIYLLISTYIIPAWNHERKKSIGCCWWLNQIILHCIFSSAFPSSLPRLCSMFTLLLMPKHPSCIPHRMDHGTSSSTPNIDWWSNLLNLATVAQPLFSSVIQCLLNPPPTFFYICSSAMHDLNLHTTQISTECFKNTSGLFWENIL